MVYFKTQLNYQNVWEYAVYQNKYLFLTNKRLERILNMTFIPKKKSKKYPKISKVVLMGS